MTQQSNDRKIPIGLNFVLDTISHNGTPPIGLGVLILCFPFALGFGGFFVAMSIPFFWNDAGIATITEIKHGMGIEGNPEDSIRFTYNDPPGHEYEHYCATTKKVNHFVVGNQYPILKYRDNWQLTTLADLDWWERHPLLWAVLSLWALAGLFIACGLCWYGIGYKMSLGKRELLRFGTHVPGMYSHNETAPIYWRILGLKKKMFRYSTDTFSEDGVTDRYTGFIRVRSKKESPDVDIFYDPLNPDRAFVLQSLGPSRNVRYSSEDDTFSTPWWITAAAWFMKLVTIAYWVLVIYCIAQLFL